MQPMTQLWKEFQNLMATRRPCVYAKDVVSSTASQDLMLPKGAGNGFCQMLPSDSPERSQQGPVMGLN